MLEGITVHADREKRYHEHIPKSCGFRETKVVGIVPHGGSTSRKMTLLDNDARFPAIRAFDPGFCCNKSKGREARGLLKL
jgi:hypothetical protein